MASTTSNCLLITPSFFGYESAIADELAAMGFSVELIDERPTNSSLGRALVRVRPELLGRQIEKYYRTWASAIRHKAFDLVVVIKAEVVPRTFLEDLRQRNPDAHFVFYTFDSLKNSPQCERVLDLFDERYSFDRSDVQTDTRFRYLPLFYARDFEYGGMEKSRKLAISFLGTLHSNRFATVDRVFSSVPRSYTYFYVQARWYFALCKYVTRGFAKVPWRRVSFKPLERSEVALLFQNSEAVLDIQRTGQSGLTMRTFETLASGCVLVTTNSAIAREDFYTPDRIIILPPELDRIDPVEIRSQLSRMRPLVGPPPNFSRYSIAAWVQNLIGEPLFTRSSEPDGDVR